MSMTDFNEFKIESVSWNIESAFKRDCGGFKLHFRNGNESHWCQIHKKSENAQRKHFGGYKTVELNSRLCKQTLHFLDKDGNTMTKLLSYQVLDIKKQEEVIGFFGREGERIADDFYEGEVIDFEGLIVWTPPPKIDFN